jgi:hypothetical protein
MNKDIIEFFSNISSINSTVVNKEKKIWMVDDFLPKDVYHQITNEIDKIDNWDLCSDEVTTRKETTKLHQSPLLQTLILLLNSNYMCEWLNKQTNQTGLIADPYLHGAGLCRTEQGAKLSLHCDFNWANHIKLNRTLNAILYLPKKWQKDWNGDLQFWNNDKSECIEKIFPLPNRLVFWTYSADLWHGMPQILKNPLDNPRDQMCIWYYSSNDKPKNNPQTSTSKT